MFLDMGDDWDLQAVVRSCCSATTSIEELPLPPPPPPLCLKQEDNYAFCFPNLHETQTAHEELEILYKPFFPKIESFSLQSISNPILNNQGFKDKQRQQPKKSPQNLTAPTTSSHSHIQTPRSKRRKNQQKRVCQVPAEGLSSDMWAWRKYGQKPIKGSPYPRGYYRCSSSKSCLARKQVERNRSDPGKIIITYTAEHNHPVPTQRNSLAGSTRQKFSASQGSNPSDEPGTPTINKQEDEILQQSKQENRDEEEEEMVEDNDEDDDLTIPEMVMEDDFFVGLDELDGSTSSVALDDCFADQLPATFSPPWLAHNAATAAGGS
ncbi:hypothetical protein NE237_011335 [Protea cynaroides]|uniref:WRKY domain-containing protein n=1 Tax=Protea cynaroides TaxID=273540 RepID=A0A9Q0GYX7_9MAGN|nr:hypothetical protein NE237_011335 [Protea cynaroides]